MRYKICSNIEGKSCRDWLYVYKLEGSESSCVMAIVDAGKPGANARARQMADESATGFRCGKDKARF